MGSAWKEEILTDSMENPHFIRVRLGDVQDHLVLSKDSAGTLRPQQHDGHVLKVYGGPGRGKMERGDMERGDGGVASGKHPSETFWVSSRCR